MLHTSTDQNGRPDKWASEKMNSPGDAVDGMPDVIAGVVIIGLDEVKTCEDVVVVDGVVSSGVLVVDDVNTDVLVEDVVSSGVLVEDVSSGVLVEGVVDSGERLDDVVNTGVLVDDVVISGVRVDDVVIDTSTVSVELGTEDTSAVSSDTLVWSFLKVVNVLEVSAVTGSAVIDVSGELVCSSAGVVDVVKRDVVCKVVCVSVTVISKVDCCSERVVLALVVEAEECFDVPVVFRASVCNSCVVISVPFSLLCAPLADLS